MPEVSYFYGIAIYMYMSEHNPPHFHVKYLEEDGKQGSDCQDRSVKITA